ncbi:MAG: hypothetical protein V1862_07415 [Methanobacteriota archaeon]
MTCIEEKFTRLSPAGKGAAEAFIDFLLLREKNEEGDTLAEDEEDYKPSTLKTTSPTPDMTISQPVTTQIILAEERMIDKKDDLIDFADINTRFTQKEKEREESRPIRQAKKLDWL